MYEKGDGQGVKCLLHINPSLQGSTLKGLHIHPGTDEPELGILFYQAPLGRQTHASNGAAILAQGSNAAAASTRSLQEPLSSRIRTWLIMAAPLPDLFDIPMVGFGTGGAKGHLISDAVRSALSSGYRHIDCAPRYGNQRDSWIGGGPCADLGLKRRYQQ